MNRRSRILTLSLLAAFASPALAQQKAAPASAASAAAPYEAAGPAEIGPAMNLTLGKSTLVRLPAR